MARTEEAALGRLSEAIELLTRAIVNLDSKIERLLDLQQAKGAKAGDQPASSR
jgi:predicted RNase H-like HicB family nuclease